MNEVREAFFKVFNSSYLKISDEELCDSCLLIIKKSKKEIWKMLAASFLDQLGDELIKNKFYPYLKTNPKLSKNVLKVLSKRIFKKPFTA